MCCGVVCQTCESGGMTTIEPPLVHDVVDLWWNLAWPFTLSASCGKDKAKTEQTNLHLKKHFPMDLATGFDGPGETRRWNPNLILKRRNNFVHGGFNQKINCRRYLLLALGGEYHSDWKMSCTLQICFSYASKCLEKTPEWRKIMQTRRKDSQEQIGACTSKHQWSRVFSGFLLLTQDSPVRDRESVRASVSEVDIQIIDDFENSFEQGEPLNRPFHQTQILSSNPALKRTSCYLGLACAWWANLSKARRFCLAQDPFAEYLSQAWGRACVGPLEGFGSCALGFGRGDFGTPWSERPWTRKDTTLDTKSLGVRSHMSTVSD